MPATVGGCIVSPQAGVACVWACVDARAAPHVSEGDASLPHDPCTHGWRCALMHCVGEPRLSSLTRCQRLPLTSCQRRGWRGPRVGCSPVHVQPSGAVGCVVRTCVSGRVHAMHNACPLADASWTLQGRWTGVLGHTHGRWLPALRAHCGATTPRRLPAARGGCSNARAATTPAPFTHTPHTTPAHSLPPLLSAASHPSHAFAAPHKSVSLANQRASGPQAPAIALFLAPCESPCVPFAASARCATPGTMAGPVPELLVKKRKRDDAWAAKREAAAVEARKKARENRRCVQQPAAASDGPQAGGRPCRGRDGASGGGIGAGAQQGRAPPPAPAYSCPGGDPGSQSGWGLCRPRPGLWHGPGTVVDALGCRGTSSSSSSSRPAVGSTAPRRSLQRRHAAAVAAAAARRSPVAARLLHCLRSSMMLTGRSSSAQSSMCGSTASRCVRGCAGRHSPVTFVWQRASGRASA